MAAGGLSHEAQNHPMPHSHSLIFGSAFIFAFVNPFACRGDAMNIVHDQISGMGDVPTIDIKLAGLDGQIFLTEQPTLFTVQMVVASYRDDERHATPEVSELHRQVWLVRTDGTSIPQSIKPDVIGISNGGYVDESLIFTFQKKSTNEVAGIVMSVGGKWYCRAIEMNQSKP
jgi:hypothetical protein